MLLGPTTLLGPNAVLGAPDVGPDGDTTFTAGGLRRVRDGQPAGLVIIHPAGREYLYADISVSPADPGAAVGVSVDDAASWHSVVRDGDVIRVLVAGPYAPPTDQRVVTLQAGRTHTVLARLIDAPEVIIDVAGYLQCGPRTPD